MSGMDIKDERALDERKGWRQRDRDEALKRARRAAEDVLDLEIAMATAARNRRVSEAMVRKVVDEMKAERERRKAVAT